MIRNLAIFIIFCLVAHTLYQNWPEQSLQVRTQVIMGTYTTIRYPSQLEVKAVEAFEEMKRLDRVLSTYKEDSQVTRLNSQGELQDASPDLLEVLSRSLEISAQTSGYFDITVGSLVNHVYGLNRLDRESPEDLATPDFSKLPEALKSLGYKGIQVEGHRLKFSRSGMKLDFGGIGKGYAVDKGAIILQSAGAKRGGLAMSGDIRCFDSCLVEVENPRDDSQPLARFQARLSNLSISTSGGYRRYAGKKKYHHLLNPKTGLSGEEVLSVTLVTQADNTLIDALATAVGVMPLSEGIELLKKTENVGYILVPVKGKPAVSSNIHQFVKELVFL